MQIRAFSPLPVVLGIKHDRSLGELAGDLVPPVNSSRRFVCANLGAIKGRWRWLLWWRLLKISKYPLYEAVIWLRCDCFAHKHKQKQGCGYIIYRSMFEASEWRRLFKNQASVKGPPYKRRPFHEPPPFDSVISSIDQQTKAKPDQTRPKQTKSIPFLSRPLHHSTSDPCNSTPPTWSAICRIITLDRAYI